MTYDRRRCRLQPWIISAVTAVIGHTAVWYFGVLVYFMFPSSLPSESMQVASYYLMHVLYCLLVAVQYTASAACSFKLNHQCKRPHVSVSSACSSDCFARRVWAL